MRTPVSKPLPPVRWLDADTCDDADATASSAPTPNPSTMRLIGLTRRAVNRTPAPNENTAMIIARMT